MKIFLLNAFLCVVGINLISLSILMYQEGWKNSGMLFWPAVIFSIVTLITTLYYWYGWNKE